MKILLTLILTFNAATAFAQEKRADLEKVVETEYAFARFANEKGVKAAFLEFLTDDSIMFNPQATNGKEMWRARPDNSPATLIWYPTFADVSSNGALAYTTGRGEYRPQGKSGGEVYYTEYFSIWRRQSDGSYKAALDAGLSHGKPPTEDKKWTSPKPTAAFAAENKPFAANAIYKFFETATLQSVEKSYKIYAAEDARFLREGKFPILGKSNALKEMKGKSKITFGKEMTQQSAGDLAYVVTTYAMKNGEQTTEKGNIIQVWKLGGGGWQIVADVFAPVPVEGK